MTANMLHTIRANAFANNTNIRSIYLELDDYMN